MQDDRASVEPDPHVARAAAARVPEHGRATPPEGAVWSIQRRRAARNGQLSPSGQAKSRMRRMR
jgi:hypothetical protein